MLHYIIQSTSYKPIFFVWITRLILLLVELRPMAENGNSSHYVDQHTLKGVPERYLEKNYPHRLLS